MTFDIIVAITKTRGIGLDGGEAWRCTSELSLFRKKTENCVLIVGRKTAEKLPYLKKRTIICLSRNKELKTDFYKNTVHIGTSLEQALSYSKKTYLNKKIFVAGGAQIYKLAMEQNPSNVHMSVMKNNYCCDTFAEFDFMEWTIQEKTVYKEFNHYIFVPVKSQEKQYLKLLSEVMTQGKTRNGRNGITRSLFTRHLSFDLRRGFPLLTTKKMFFRGIVEELLFFIKGKTDSKLLEKKNVNIWKENTRKKFLDENGLSHYEEGIMGPMYGWQWRHFGSEYNQHLSGSGSGFDQLQDVINKIRSTPSSRRILMTDYNPAQAAQGVLYPCHSLMLQFYVDGKYLDMYCFNRSSDLFLGLPFNIASSSLLLTIIAKVCNLEPRNFNLTLGDLHIYKQHYDVVSTQTKRCPFPFPVFKLETELNNMEDIENLTVKDFALKNYKYHPRINAKMIQ